MTKAEAKEREDARAELRAILKPGDTVYTILRQVSRSGMSRQISVLVRRADGGMWHPNYAVSKATGIKLARGGWRDALTLNGCGMDMGFELVYVLSSALYPDGFGCIGEAPGHVCPANDHHNGDPLGYAPHTAKAPHWHTHSGGYALRQEWL